MKPNETEPTVPACLPTEFLDRLRPLVDAFISEACAAQAKWEAATESLFNEPAIIAFSKREPNLFEAICSAEMKRMAEALPQ